MRAYSRLISLPLVWMFLITTCLSGLFPVTANAMSKITVNVYRTVGALIGAVSLAALAANFGPVGMMAAGIVGGGAGFAGGATLGGIIGGNHGGVWGVFKGVALGGVIGASLGLLAGAALGVNFAVVGIIAGGLLGASLGSKIIKAFIHTDDEDTANFEKTKWSDIGITRSGQAIKRNHNNVEIVQLKKQLIEAQRGLRRAALNADKKAYRSAYKEYQAAELALQEATASAAAATAAY